jgi:pre-rRNA-processing protein TSR1
MISKIDRRHKARQIAQNKHKTLLKETKIFDGRKGAPRIVAVVPLCEDGDAAAAVKDLSEMEAEVPESGVLTTG